MTTSERVVEILVKEGLYRELPKPFKVGSLSFDFTHALVAGSKANDLVIVIELKGDTIDAALVRKVLALTRALDVLGSRRSVTAVLTSGQATTQTVLALGKVCRVLPIGAPSGHKAVDSVRDWLSVLLPLRGPTTFETKLDWEGDVRNQVSDSEGVDLLFEEILKSASLGQATVEQVFANRVRVVVNDALIEDQGDE